MLFNSPEFILVFLPVTVMVYQLLCARAGERAPLLWLVLASLVFYGYWHLGYVVLIAVSVVVNYLFAVTLTRTTGAPRLRGRLLLVLGVSFNLALLAYFKYANFFLDTVAQVTGDTLAFERVILPIGISFFTFQQIAYLVDVRRREAGTPSLLKYCLFVCFFPQLIAGPIVHHREVMPQFRKQAPDRIGSDVAVGLTIFVIGLFKKVVIADGLAQPASALFDGAADGLSPSLVEAWAGTVFYAFQIYFDFSGYSDMAIGLARLFGIRLPMNFASPYKATSIIDFWRRWHITLSRFLRDYLYIPLGGSRRGPARRYLNVFVTMLLGGIWHGAGWTFVLWGALHGVFIVINQMWRARQAVDLRTRRGWPRHLGRALTFVLVVIAWVPFRADSLETCFAVYGGMIGLNGFGTAASLGFETPALMLLLALLLFFVWGLPNTQQIMRGANPTLATAGYPATRLLPAAQPALLWNGRRRWSVAAAALFLVCYLKLNDGSEFLYFQF